MATRRSSANQDTTPAAPQAGTPSPAFGGHHDHSFTLQAVMEMHKSIGSLEASVTNLSAQIGSQKQSMDDLKSKVGHVEKVMYAAGVILLITLAIGGWLLSSAKDFAMTYYKASIDAQLKQPPQPAPTPPQAKR